MLVPLIASAIDGRYRERSVVYTVFVYRTVLLSGLSPRKSRHLHHAFQHESASYRALAPKRHNRLAATPGIHNRQIVSAL